MRQAALLALVATALALTPLSGQPRGRREQRVEVVALPGGGMQPQAIVDANDVLHVLYFAGAPAGGDLFYVTRAPGTAAFSTPLRVNSEPGSAIATGSVRGGQIALGRNGWVHVAWNASHPIDRDGEQVTPMWYARLPPGAGRFEAQRAMGAHTRHLDGGGSVAADAQGAVYVSWHAAGPVDGETRRSVYVATSRDDGGRFDPEKTLVDTGGVCGCCGLRSLVDARDRLQILYRAAGENVHRDATWVTAAGRGSARPVTLQAWELPACPMTTFAMANAGSRIVAAWETAQQIYMATLNPERGSFTVPVAMNGAAIRKHPSLAVDRSGDTLVAWTEGTAWARGGTAAWQLYDPSGRLLSGAADVATVPVWGLVAAVARADGSFVILR
jgi:hypothetical protein